MIGKVFVAILFLMCFSVFPGKRSLFAQVSKADFIQLNLVDLKVERTWQQILGGKKVLKIYFEARNTTHDAIWLCTARAYNEKYNVSIEREGESNILKIKLRSYAFDKKNVILDSAIKGRFQKILPGEHLGYELKVLFPITTGRRVFLNDIGQIQIELQYYENKVIRGNKECCEKTSTSQVVYIDSFWVYRSPGKSANAIFKMENIR